MTFPSEYRCLRRNRYEQDGYAIVPIRYEDRLDIMQWRNEQIYHLRQAKPLTIEDQDFYFQNTVASLFDQEQPTQILFSYLENGVCIGYGGLVHINWVDKNAEISFIMKTELEGATFGIHWNLFLSLLTQVAFEDLELHKLTTFAFDLRPHLYPILETNGFYQEARLAEHCRFGGKYIDVVIHSKINN